ncbi:hypothetical protein H2248_008440 [Termitomyces sp. 'cryptogamus']|nr:hypothetical protein H2248_008440 [Termitomyces sp. 'cryptogamus']
MSTSCGNPETETGALMLRRPKFDKSKQCVRCKEKTGNIVIRHAVYCKECFSTLISVKFRRALDPTVNPLPDGPRRKGLKAGGDLLIGFSGGLGSTVLLDLMYRTYFSFHDAPIDLTTGKPRGGKDHPRNLLVWSRGSVCYVEPCNAFPGMKDRTEHIRAIVEQYEDLTFIPLRIEDAFSRDWWDSVGGKHISDNLGIDLTNEDLLLSSISNEGNEGYSKSPVQQLQKYIFSLPTQTAILSTVQTLTRILLLHTASAIGSSHLLLGTSLTSLSISLISSISQGGGFVVREEGKEEWVPPRSVTQMKTNGHENGNIRVVRPLQDIGMKECAMWAWWHGLNVVGREKFPGGKQSIGQLTKDFIVGLERDYPSTVSTIARTCSKLAPKHGTDGICLFCQRPAQYGLQDWRAQTAIRSFKSITSYRPPHFPERDTTDVPTSPSLPSLTPFLCYHCHTTLTSRSSRGTTAVSVSKDDPTPMPLWVTSSSAASTVSSTVRVATQDPYSGEEIWNRKKMDVEQMKATVAEFLFE